MTIHNTKSKKFLTPLCCLLLLLGFGCQQESDTATEQTAQLEPVDCSHLTGQVTPLRSCELALDLPPALEPVKDYYHYIAEQYNLREKATIALDTFKYLDTALLLFEQVQSPKYNLLKAELHALKGNILKAYNLPQEAIREFRHSIKALETIPSDDSCSWLTMANIHNMMGLNYIDLHDKDNAEENFRKAIQLFTQAGRIHQIFSVYTNLGLVYQDAGEPSTAIRYHQLSLCVWESLPDTTRAKDSLRFNWIRNSLALALEYKGDSLKQVGAREAAKQFYRYSTLQHHTNLNLLKKMSFSGEVPEIISYNYANLAFGFSKREAPEAADSTIYYAEKCMETARSVDPALEEFLGVVCNRHMAYAIARQGNYLEASYLIDSAIAAFTLQEQGTDEVIVSNPTYYSNFLFSKGEILRICAKQDSNSQVVSESPLAAYEEAIRYFEVWRRSQALNTSLEAMMQRRIRYFDQGFETAIDCFMQSQHSTYLERAFQVSERAKSFTLRQGINRQIANWQERDRFGDFLVEEFRFRDQIAVAEQAVLQDPGSEADRDQLRSLKESFAQFIDRLKNSDNAEEKAFFNIRFNTKIPSLQYIQQNLLDEKTALIEYLLGTEQGWALIITKDNVQVADFRIDEGLRKTINKYQKSLQSRNDDYLEAAQSLYQLLFSDTDKLLKEQGEIENLIIIPDKQLSGVLFEGLLTKPANGSSFQNLNYLLKSYKISYHYSVTSLVQSLELLHSRPSAEQRFAAYSAAIPDGLSCGGQPLDSLIQLPEALIREYFSPEQASHDHSAYKENFLKQAGDAAIVQLSLHGCETIGNSGNFFLEFHPQPGDINGHLNLQDIYGLRMRSQLVVLSNCHTAEGSNIFGEGRMSLARAFNYAGCTGIVASMSSVPDASTAKVLELFYRKLLADPKPDPAMALAEAKLDYLDDNNEHPWSWNNLIYIGANQPLIMPDGNESLSYSR